MPQVYFNFICYRIVKAHTYIAKIAACVELRLVFRAAQKLSCLTRLKSKLNVLSQSGVVYQISCSQCEAFYVGKARAKSTRTFTTGLQFPVQAFL